MTRTIIAIALSTLIALILMAVPALAETAATSTVYVPLATKANTPTIVPTPVPQACAAIDRVKELEVLRLINVERAKVGLPALVEDAHLTIAARCYAEDMAMNGVTNHIGSDGSTAFQRMINAGYTGTPWTENIGGYYDAAGMVHWWMNSLHHRGAILSSDITELGVGYWYNRNAAGDYWTVDFGRR